MTPRPYQLVGRDFLAARPRALLADEMRVGKTPQAILAAHAVGAQTVLVVCPAIAVPGWERAFRDWWPGAILPRLRVMSYDAARSWWQSGASGALDVMIADEAHFAGNPLAGRTQMVYGRTGLGSQARHLWSLSGTPAPRHAGQLWTMLVHFGAYAGDYGPFLREYCWPVGGKWHARARVGGTKLDRVEELRAMLAPFVLRRTRREVAPEMPEVSLNALPLPGRAPAAFDGAPADPDELAGWIAANAAHLAEERIHTALAKVPALAEHVHFMWGNGMLPQTVIFGHHYDPLAELHATLMARGMNGALVTGATPAGARHKVQLAFLAGELDFVAANILTAGTAIDLSSARHGYMLEQSWVPGDNAQAVSRLVNVSRTDPVTVDVVTLPGSIDERIQAVLARRTRELSSLI